MLSKFSKKSEYRDFQSLSHIKFRIWNSTMVGIMPKKSRSGIFFIPNPWRAKRIQKFSFYTVWGWKKLSAHNSDLNFCHITNKTVMSLNFRELVRFVQMWKLPIKLTWKRKAGRWVTTLKGAICVYSPQLYWIKCKNLSTENEEERRHGNK